MHAMGRWMLLLALGLSSAIWARPQTSAPQPASGESPPVQDEASQALARKLARITGSPPASDRCFAQCQRGRRECVVAPSISDSACRSRLAPRGKSCQTLGDPAARNNCLSETLSCQTRGNVDTCEARLRSCLAACTP